MDNKKNGLHISADNLHVSRGQRQRTFTDTSQERNATEQVKISRDDAHRISQLRVFEITPAISCQSFPFAPVRKDGEGRARNDDVERGIPASERGFVALDGGYGWVIVAAAFVSEYTLGIIFAGFSILYVDIAEHFGSTKSSVGLIGSLFLFTGSFLAFLYSPLIERYGCRVIGIIGACISTTGFIFSSFATSVEYLYVTYGVISGLGNGLLLLTSIVTVQMYFNKKRLLAHGISVCGMHFGGLTSGPLLRFWVDNCGLHGTFLLLGGVYLQNIVVGALYRPLLVTNTQGRLSEFSQDDTTEEITNTSYPKNGDGDDANLPKGDVITDIKDTSHEDDALENKQTMPLPPSAKRKEKDINSNRSRESKGECDSVIRFLKEAFDVELLRDGKKCLMFVVAVFIQFAIMTLYSQAYGRAVYIGISPNLAALLVTIQSVGTLIGGLLSSFIGMKIKQHILVYAGSIFAMGSAVIAVTLTTNLFGMAIVGVTGAVSCGFVMTLQTPVLVNLFGVERIARSQAFHSMAVSLGFLCALPFGGWLFDISQSYFLPYLVCGVIGLLSSGIVIIMALVSSRKKPDSPFVQSVKHSM